MRLNRLSTTFLCTICPFFPAFSRGQTVMPLQITDHTRTGVSYFQQTVEPSLAVGSLAVHGLRSDGIDPDKSGSSSANRGLTIPNSRFNKPSADSPAHAPAVQIRLYDYAGLNQQSFHKIASLAQEILHRAGISGQVEDCTREVEASCECSQERLKCLSIRFLASTQETTRNVPVLGQSYLVSQGGEYASIFVREVRVTAADENIPSDLLSSYAVAHEVGHLLLGASHTPRGLMKARWQRVDYHAMTELWLYFSEEQERRLTTLYGVPPADSIAAHLPPTRLENPARTVSSLPVR